MTREDALAVFRAGPEAVVDLLLAMDARIRALCVIEERFAVLEGMLAKNSRNSSKPPSSDGLAKPAPKSLRKPSGRKPGGQPGHLGRTLERVETPDVIELHRVEHCECCGKALGEQAPDQIEKRQMHDLPPIQLVVTEHRAEVKRCGCGHLNKAAFPVGIRAPTQYGPNIKAVAVYLNQYQLLPYARTCEALENLLGAPMSEGSLANILDEAAALSEEPVARIAAAIRAAPVAHFDETGLRVGGNLCWQHTASTAHATFFSIHARRGTEAMDEADILPGFGGTAVHDYWKPYLSYTCFHALCNAHHLRDLTFVHEQLGQPWADEAAGLLVRMKQSAERANADGLVRLPAEELAELEQRWQEVIDQGYASNPLPPVPPGRKKRGKPKKGKGRNLVERFDQRRHEVLAFLYDFTVPFDNNLAERDLRMGKVRQKISGQFKRIEHARNFCRIRSYISTARKNSVQAFESLIGLFTDNPFLLPAPE